MHLLCHALTAVSLATGSAGIGRPRLKRQSTKSTAVRQRATRARQAAGRVSREIDIHEHDVAKALIASDRLSADQTLDPELTKAALQEIVADFVERWRPYFRKCHT